MTSDDKRSDADAPTPLARVEAIQDELRLLTRELTGLAGDAAPPMGEEPDDAALEQMAAGLLWQRSVFATHLDATLFVDPATNLMLFLYAAGREQTASSGACCEAARVPRTTALRWIAILEDKGLLTSTVDKRDRRKASIGLSEAGRAIMRRCLLSIATTPSGGVSAA